MSTVSKKGKEKAFRKISLEFRRGSYTLAVLGCLEQELYGYSLINKLQQKGLDITQDTLYPLLRRLEDQKLLESSWKIDGSRPRKYYKATELGREVFIDLKKDWINLTAILQEIVA